MELDESRRGKSKALLFSFTEMTEIVKKRFSKTGAEEFSNMLYNLATKHGYLDEEFSKAIDEIVPAGGGSLRQCVIGDPGQRERCP